MKILFLSAWFPYPPDNGSKLRVYNLLRGLAQKHQVTLISFAEPVPEQIPEALEQMCQQVYALPARQYEPGSRKALLGLLAPKPRVLVDRFAPEMAGCIRQALESGSFDVVVASQWYMADYLKEMPGTPAIFEEVEVGVFIDRVQQAPNLASRVRHGLTTLKMQGYFRSLMERFSASTVVSEEEAQLLRGMVGSQAQIEVIPNGVRLDDYSRVQVEPQPGSLIFTGSFTYSPNYEAMQWFMRQVFPLVQAAVPDARVIITGNHKNLPLENEDAITRTGFVQDIRPLVAGAWASLAPLHTGGGTRLKILEAMALRSPVIATTKGAQGLDVCPGEHLLIADDPQEFAQAAIRLLQDPVLRHRLVENAYRMAAEKYDWEVILPGFLRLVESAAGA
jgi:polysaccharide biosynthesis protein PslH